MKSIELHEPCGGLVVIESPPTKYELHHDPITGDWQITSPGDSLLQGDWMLTKQDAIDYVLERVGILSDADYERAPTRCDA